MKKIGVLGAGISGLSFARLANRDFEVEILEKNDTWGGIARTRDVGGLTYHPVGGHCFNSKFQDVLDFVFNEVLSKDNWHLVNRNAVIKLRGQEINYPIEYSIKQINAFDPELAFQITKDFLAAEDDFQYASLEEWFRKKFGDTLADLYFIPYNKKIWNKDPSAMSHEWVEGKLPIPDQNSFFQALLSEASDKMPHASFYYPNSNNQNTFIDALASGLNITCNYQVTDIYFSAERNKWIVNNEKEFDLLINTIPLNIFPSLLRNAPETLLSLSSQLRYNSVTTMFWKTKPTTRTWTYIPESDNFFHRYIHIGNFFEPKENVTITEVVGKKTYEEMVENGKQDPFLLEPLSFNVSDHAYVVYDQNYATTVGAIKEELDGMGIFTLGRFGEWEYYNMDICIKKAMDLAKIIKSTKLD